MNLPDAPCYDVLPRRLQLILAAQYLVTPLSCPIIELQMCCCREMHLLRARGVLANDMPRRKCYIRGHCVASLVK